ncbi:hypothetical protein [Mycobacterium asiaticum]|uniref:Haemophore haem-binding domain-containing protein n=1 Tax=Mycobacterium asiaticum TaxID=1790 RepID=A0A1A3CL35_MYCAS|nr:hypothetical protein [Mycobacterium asiaticum]OBI87428.1 hypothetical protein A5661_00980 [Mycobacterium asiaticum]OBJ54654.1 hypothetical protein A9W94_20925 [Mycobacterium asiaticum]OBJ85493.1 hypothetical protein A5640_02000 [Mycobacterium asiaticum]ORA09091.1 hypothetical protein BST16_25555 [Mycobacterium asiaticum DSM 44297]
MRKGLVVGGLLGAIVSATIAMPVATADPQQCNTTFGQTASEQVQGYLDRHPDVKAEITARSQASGSGTNLVDYLNRHPDVRQALVTLANQCTS